jgi:hypothetical protein
MRKLEIILFVIIISVFECKTFKNKDVVNKTKTESSDLNLVKGSFDKNIPEKIRLEIKILNDKLFKSIKENNLRELKTILSTKLLEKTDDGFDSLIYQISNNLSKSNSYAVKNEFHMINSNSNVFNYVPFIPKNEYDFSIKYLALNKEMYGSLLIPDTEPDQMLITCIYGKYGNDWKINILQFGLYSLINKNAIDFYKEAQNLYSKNYLVDAVNTLFLLRQCAKPANEYFQYKLEEEMKNFYDSVMTEIQKKYVFPNELSAISTKPKIFNIFPQYINEGYFPSVEYLTTIPMNDTLNLRKENDEIHKIIGTIYNGIDKGKKYLFYKAWSRMPDGKTKVNTYGFYKKLE